MSVTIPVSFMTLHPSSGVLPALFNEVFCLFLHQRADKVLNKMKFATVLVASATAQERYFSTEKFDHDKFDWWTPSTGFNQMKKMRSTTGKFLDAYFPNAAGVRERYAEKWTKLQDDMESAAADCTFADKGANGRKRRDANEERFMNNFFENDFNAGDAVKDFRNFQEGHARWIVMEVKEGCPVKAEKLLRRVDRFRFAMNWRYCKEFEGLPASLSEDTQDQDPVGFCWWAYFHNGQPKKHPRNWKAISEGKFSINGEQ